MKSLDSIPPLNALRAFEVAARLESLTRAAEELEVTQAAVSQQVKTLEEFLGTRLFARQGRRLSLTDAGRAYLPILTSAFDSVRDSTRELFRAGGQTLVRVRVASSFAQRWLLPRLGRFYARYPDIRLRLLATTWPSSGGEVEGADLEIANSYGDWTGMQVERLTREHWQVVASPALLERYPAIETAHQLLALPLIGIHGYQENWRSWFREAGVHDPVPPPVLETDTSSLAIEAAIAGTGLLLVRSLLVADALAQRQLALAHPLTLETSGGHFLVFPGHTLPSAKVQAFCQWLKAELQADGWLSQASDSDA